jgi:acetyl-CoA carboxylase carboxyltransferase component
MSLEDKLNELRSRQEELHAGGGEKRIAKQHEQGKMAARERISALLDADSFMEVDAFVKHRGVEFGMSEVQAPGEGVVVGFGTIDGRLVYVASQDFTVLGGSLGEMHAQKICKVMDMAIQNGAPFIAINESGGARIHEGVDALNGYGNIFFRNTKASGVIPQISVIMGTTAGGAVYSPGLTDFIVMVEGKSNMFITGPQVIKAVTGEDVSMEDLGGAVVHAAKSGVAHFVAQDDTDCLNLIRTLVSYLPSNNMEDPPYVRPTDSPARRDESLLEIVPDEPNKPYDVHDVITAVFDNGDFLEVQPQYAANIVTGFARLNGHSVGIIANQPKVMAGCLDINASDKASRFIRFCDAFSIPIITLVDVPGYLPGVQQEYGGIIRHGSKLLYAYSEATVAKLTVILRKAYGGAYLAMCSRSLGADVTLAWPTAEIAVMGPEGAVNIIFRKDIEAAADPAQARAEAIATYRGKFATPYVAAARGLVDDVIDPRDTRPLLINYLEANLTKREGRPQRKHGNFPV